jgi:hypothetical protein
MVTPRAPTALAVGFELGLYSRDDVAEWVPEAVDRVDVLPDPLLELTTLKGKQDVDIVTLLYQLGPARRPAERARDRFAVLHELLTTNRINLGDAARQMYRIALEDLSPDDEGGEYFACLSLDDQYDLARDGTYGTLDDVRRGVVDFLQRYASRL